MSGGYFDYVQDRLLFDCIEPLEKIIRRGNSDWSEETNNVMKLGLQCAKIAHAYLRRIDWFLCGDDSEESLHIRLKEDVEKAFIQERDISSSFIIPEGGDVKIFEYQSAYTRAVVEVGYGNDGYYKWATLYTIETKNTARRQGHANIMIEFLKHEFYDLTSLPTNDTILKNLLKKYEIKECNDKKIIEEKSPEWKTYKMDTTATSTFTTATAEDKKK